MNMSFYDWCIKNNRKDLLEQWDDERNDITSKDISYMSRKAFYFKCSKLKHESEKIIIQNLTRRVNERTACKKCKSIAQYLIDSYGEHGIEQYWDYDLNNDSPWDINAKSHTVVYLKCQNTDYHGSYDVEAKHFTCDNVRCPYCFHRRVHPKDSLSQYCIDNYEKDFLDKYWDYNLNSVSPWEISPKSSNKVYFKCLNNAKHASFLITLGNFFKGFYCCPECQQEIKNHKIDILKRLVDGRYVSEEDKNSVMAFEDLTGKRFGRLTVVGFDYQKYLDALIDNKSPDYYWICKCDCNGENSVKSITADHLKSNKIVSCGCWKREKATGENSWNWKGGVNSETHKARYTPEGKQWQMCVLKRDNYSCQCCGRSTNLNIHHIYNFVNNAELRYNIDNGIVLCEDCHSMVKRGAFHYIYGAKNNTPEQLREYILNKSNIDIYITHPKILTLTQQND